MGMMLLRIELFFHAFQAFVYSISISSSITHMTFLQEENDQAFSITR